MAHEDSGDIRLARVEVLIDELRQDIKRLYTNGLSALGSRVSALEAVSSARRDGRAEASAVSGRWMTVVGWLVGGASAANVAILVYVLNHLGGK